MAVGRLWLDFVGHYLGRGDDFDLGALVFFAANFLLARLNARCCRRISRYETSVSAAIDMVLFAEVVFVEQPAAEASNADKKSSWIASFSLARCQWPRPQIAFHDGSGCLTTRNSVGAVGADGGFGGMGKAGHEVGAGKGHGAAFIAASMAARNVSPSIGLIFPSSQWTISVNPSGHALSPVATLAS